MTHERLLPVLRVLDAWSRKHVVRRNSSILKVYPIKTEHNTKLFSNSDFG
jgi:hypothetical protein